MANNRETTFGRAAAGRYPRVVAGPITFMVEYRSVGQGGNEASGPTIRVLDGEDDHEYLRFDLFDINPHYHYSPRGGVAADTGRVVMLDTVAEGEPVAWAIDRLHDRLRPMLASVGGENLVDALDEDTLSAAVDEVQNLLHEAQATQPA